MNFNLIDMTPKFNILGKCGSGSPAPAYQQLLEYDCFVRDYNYSYFPLMNNLLEYPSVRFENISNLNNAFRETRMTNIYNPIYTSHTVNVPAAYAFYDCDWLESFSIDTTRINTFSNAFDGCYSLYNISFVNPTQEYSLNMFFDYSPIDVEHMLQTLPYSNNMSYVRFYENMSDEVKQQFLTKNWTVLNSL